MNDNIFKYIFKGSYYLNVTAIIGHNAEIPCELTPHSKTDNAYLVLWWFKDIFGTPIYGFLFNFDELCEKFNDWKRCKLAENWLEM